MSEEWRQTKLKKYYPFYGRGYVQLTWKGNYAAYARILGGDCDLVGKPDLALQPDIALFVLVHGMSTGSFTGAKLSSYVNARAVDYTNARRVINGLDAAPHIAALAQSWNDRYAGLWC